MIAQFCWSVFQMKCCCQILHPGFWQQVRYLQTGIQYIYYNNRDGFWWTDYNFLLFVFIQLEKVLEPVLFLSDMIAGRFHGVYTCL